ncbi:MAG TPA: GWxTD domain-containing protein [Bacteroidales bacterium]|nr:GWxTD domain-containing protein [Bacteroidales bacterium]
MANNKLIHLYHNQCFGKTLLILAIILATATCKTTNQTTYTNLAAHYQPDEESAISGIRIFHETDSLTRVYLQYSTGGLLYQQPPNKEFLQANYSISYQLFSSYECSTVLDEQTFRFSDSLYATSAAELTFDFAVQAFAPETYLLQIRFADLNKDEAVLYPRMIYKASPGNTQNFLPVDENGAIVYTDWISWKTKFNVRTNRRDLGKMVVSYFEESFPPAIPPFAGSHPEAYQYRPQKTTLLPLANGQSEYVQYVKEGIYHFQNDTTQREGLTLFRFYDDYPEVTRPKQMVEPLRYLTSNTEFKQLEQSLDPRQAIDSFWVATAGNPERATELIRDYYSRVQYANRYFTSHKEGWKTDRGMLYIIYGAPSTVYRRKDIETWIYGKQGNRVFLRFDFIRAINPFTNNDFELQRDPQFKEQWYNAVYFWRR